MEGASASFISPNRLRRLAFLGRGAQAARMLFAVAMLPALGHAQNAGVSVPLMLAPDSERQGFVRIINESNQSGSVRITAYDDVVNAANGPVVMRLTTATNDNGRRLRFYFTSASQVPSRYVEDAGGIAYIRSILLFKRPGPDANFILQLAPQQSGGTSPGQSGPDLLPSAEANLRFIFSALGVAAPLVLKIETIQDEPYPSRVSNTDELDAFIDAVRAIGTQSTRPDITLTIVDSSLNVDRLADIWNVDASTRCRNDAPLP